MKGPKKVKDDDGEGTRVGVLREGTPHWSPGFMARRSEDFKVTF